MSDNNKHVTEEQVDELYLRMNNSNKKSITLSWFIYVVIFLLLITLFVAAISNLNEQLTLQITANEKLVNRLDTIETEMKAIRKNIYAKSGISVKEVQQQLVSDVIAKKVNRRASPEQQKLLETYQSQEDYSDLRDNIYYLAKAVDLSTEGKLSQALDMVNQSITLNDNISTSYSVKSAILAKQQDLVKAISAQTQAINIESKLPFSEVLPNYYNTRGFLYIKQEQLDRAIADFYRGSDIAVGDEKSFILENAVLVALYQEKWQDAFELSTKLIAFNVDGGWKWFLRAIAADKINDKSARREARSNWQKSINANPNTNTINLLKASLENSNLTSYQKWL